MIAITLLLIHIFAVEGKSYLEEQGITEYQLVHFDLNELDSLNVLQFNFNGQDYKVQLERNENIAPIITAQTQSNSNTRHPKMEQICHYHGTVLNYDAKSMVSLSLCDGHGIRGSIRAFGKEIWIYPAKYALSDSINNGTRSIANNHIADEHVIYEQSDVSLHPEPIDMTDMTRRRLARWNNGDNVIEVYLLADKTLVDYWKTKEGSNWYSAMFTFLGDMMNTADGYYRGTNWGSDIGSISVKWVALDIVESWSGIFSDLSTWQSGSYTNYLNKFMAWYKVNKDMTDFDYAMIYGSQTNFANEGNIGYSWYDSVCNDEYKCGMMSNTWEFLFNVRDQAELFSHELGHNLGARHDDDTRYCSSVDSTNNIMKSNIGENGFSPCSISRINEEFVDQDGYPCLVRRTNAFENNYDGSGSGTTPTPRPTPYPTRSSATPKPTPSPTSGSSSGGSYIDVTIAHSQDTFMSFWLKNTDGISVSTMKIKASNSNWMTHSQDWYGGSYYGTLYGFNQFTASMTAPLSVKLISSSGQEITSWNIIPSRASWSSGTMTQSFSSAFTISDEEANDGITTAAWVVIVIGICLLFACIIGCIYYRRNKKLKTEVTFNHGDADDNSNRAEIELSDDGKGGDKTEVNDVDNDAKVTGDTIEVGDDSDDHEAEIEIDVEVEAE